MKRTAWSGLSGEENNAAVEFVPVGWLHPFEYIISLREESNCGFVQDKHTWMTPRMFRV
jgi:hypothetical protein